MSIKQDQAQFDRKIKKLKKEGLKKYFSSESIIVPRPHGKKLQVPIRNLQIPRFRFGLDDSGGVAQGDGEVGDPIPGMDPDQGVGPGHGSGRGEHDFTELTLEEAAEMLGEELELPNLLDKFEGKVGAKSYNRYTSIQRVGPEALRHGKRTFRQGLLRGIITGDYNPDDPLIIPIHGDKRYRSAKEATKPTTKAAVIYLLDYSGSMYNVIDFLQNVGWWADAWIKKHYDSVVHRYVQYDSVAQEVTAENFYSVQAGGGTDMRAGLSLAKKIAKSDFPESEYNLYVIHFTDGDCYGIEVSEEYVQQYQDWKEQHPDLEDGFEAPEAGNPLTDFLIPRCSALFVCEAGAYYGGRISFGGFEMGGNYSDLLQNLTETRPSLEAKIRCVSFTDEDIKEGRGESIKKTLVHWFK